MGRVIKFPSGTMHPTESTLWSHTSDSAMPSPTESAEGSNVVRLSVAWLHGTHDDGGGGSAA